MNNLIVGIIGSLIATFIVSIFSRGKKEADTAPSRFRWFWRLSYLVGKLSFFYGLIVVTVNLAFKTDVAAHNIAVGGAFFTLGLIAWLFGYLFQ